MTKSKALRQSEQRALRKRFEIHALSVLDGLGSGAPQENLECRIECMGMILDLITATLETARYRETLVELKARVADRGRVAVEPLGYERKPHLRVVN